MTTLFDPIKILRSELTLSCVSSMGAIEDQRHHLQSAAWTSHQPALSTDRSRRCETSFVALHRHTGQSRPVAISSGRHHNDLHSAESIQERPLSSREVKTWLSDCGVSRYHRSRIPVFPPLA